MRKILILLLGAMMALTFAACGGKDDKPSSPSNSVSNNDSIIELPEDPF